MPSHQANNQEARNCERGQEEAKPQGKYINPLSHRESIGSSVEGHRAEGPLVDAVFECLPIISLRPGVFVQLDSCMFHI